MSQFSSTDWQPQSGDVTVKTKATKKSAVIPVNGTIMWPYLSRRNDKSNKFQYDLCQLSERAVKELESTLGIDVSFKEEKGFYLTLKSGYEIEVEGATPQEIGNGTQVKALVGSYTNGYGTWPRPVGSVVVTELVAYEGKGTTDLSSVEAF